MIYIVSIYYPPVSNPPANRMGQLTRMLCAKYGKENVRVVTGRPNYPHGELRPEHRWKLFARGIGEYGERIDHIYEFPAAFKGLYRKTFGQLTFALSVFFYFLFRRIKKDDIVLVTSGPVFPIYSFLFLSYLRRRLRYVVDVRDLWPQVVAGMGFMQETSVAYRFLRKMADATYRRADGLVGNSQGICEYLRETVPGRDVALVFNPVDMKLLSPLDEQERESIINAHSDIFINDGRPLFLFSGTFSNYIGLNDLFAAWVKLKARTGRWRFIMIGQGEGEVGMRKCISENGLEDQVKLLPFMDRSELVKYIGAADYCFASLRNSPMLRYAIPTKVIEYLACGKPVVAVVGGAFGEMLKEEGVAHVCEPGDVDGMVDMLLGIIESATAVNAERNPREFIRRYFSVEAFDKGFGSFFDGICQNS